MKETGYSIVYKAGVPFLQLSREKFLGMAGARLSIVTKFDTNGQPLEADTGVPGDDWEMFIQFLTAHVASGSLSVSDLKNVAHQLGVNTQKAS